MKKLYYFRKFKSSQNDSKKSWSNIKQLLNSNKRSNISEIIDNDRCYKGDKLPAVFNDHFTNVVSRIVSDLPENINEDYLMGLPTNPHSCFLIPTNNTEMLDVIMQMGNKGNVLYDVTFKFIKLVLPKILPVLVFIYNMCLESGIYPDIMKVARVIPLYKSGSVTSLNNYRPISTLISFNKIFERLTHNRLNDFISKFFPLSRFQFGFKLKSSTTLAIFAFLKDLFNTFNKSQYTIALFLDLKKAFDSVNKDILLYKLQCFGFRGISNAFIRSYLSNRFQYVCINGYRSSSNLVLNGVPQGSVLGPLLFNVFINDFCGLKDYNKILFADDAVFYVTYSKFVQLL